MPIIPTPAPLVRDVLSADEIEAVLAEIREVKYLGLSIIRCERGDETKGGWVVLESITPIDKLPCRLAKTTYHSTIAEALRAAKAWRESRKDGNP